jgi:hypothetical protein
MARAYLLAPTLLLFCAAAHASDGVRLDGLAVAGSRATGTCGNAAVRVQGIDPDNPYRVDGLISANGVITIKGEKTTLTIGGEPTSGIYLQDQNKLHCLASPKGPRLVLASYCFGRDCAEVDYRVIDPAAARVISSQNSAEECDEACAEKALGMKLPTGLGSAL